MATEDLLMAAVRAGGDRQDLHERIRIHSHSAAARLRNGEEGNDLIERLKSDSAFPSLNFASVLDASRFVGRSPEQVVSFIEREVEPIRSRYPNLRAMRFDVDV